MKELPIIMFCHVPPTIIKSANIPIWDWGNRWDTAVIIMNINKLGEGEKLDGVGPVDNKPSTD